MTDQPGPHGRPRVDEEALRRHLAERREAAGRARRRRTRWLLAAVGGLAGAGVLAIALAVSSTSPPAATTTAQRPSAERPAPTRAAAPRPARSTKAPPHRGQPVVQIRPGGAGRSSAPSSAPIAPGASPAPAPVTTGLEPPAIVQRPIPFGPDRKAQMAEYSRIHYGPSEATWVLTPRVIVEHYTAGTSFSSAFNTFAANSPDRELGQLPGTCAHFVIDSDGTIYQLVPTDIRCRHTVGLNYAAIGIEHVGTSDAQVLSNPRQMAASLALTRWLMGTYGISLVNVIGHAESLSSPYHRELYAPWAHQTHGDWTRPDMDVYRQRLAST